MVPGIQWGGLLGISGSDSDRVLREPPNRLY